MPFRPFVRSAVLAALLLAARFSSAQEPAAGTAEQRYTLPALTPIDLVIEETVSSDVHENGQRFPLRVAEDVLVDGAVVVPAGSRGEGEVVHAARSRRGGKAGELILAARYVQVGETRIALRSFAAGSGKDRSTAALAIAATLGFPALFVRGGVFVVPADTLAHAKTAEDLVLPSAAATFHDEVPAPDVAEVQSTEEP